jgi:hypothetical protein
LRFSAFPIATDFPAMAHTRLALACLLAAVLAAPPARAGGGPESVLLVVLPWKDGDESVPIDRFRAEILQPILRAIDSRRLAPQIDQVVYSCGFPWRVDFAAEMPAELAKQQMFKFPSGSLTGMTMLHGAVTSGGPNWLDPESNRYFQPPGDDGVPESTVGFRGWYGWGGRGDLLEMGGNRYLLATMLGVTAGRGNSVREVVAALRSAAAADGSRPRGTIYLMANADVRTRARSGPFKGVAKAMPPA